MRQNIITIDGPAGVGKSTISRRVAARLGFTYLDTGAMYRAAAYLITASGIDEKNTREIAGCLEDMELELVPAQNEREDVRVILSGGDVSKKIRTPEMSMIASRVSAIPEVREKLTAMQRKMGEKGKIVAEGRDTGTVVFPLAAHKFFLDARPKIRARRRAAQLGLQGKKVDEQELLTMMVERDEKDRRRDIAPLKKAEDALYIDTSTLDIDGVADMILNRVASNLSGINKE
ncbi:MAG: cytidylate kinase [Deltaproteobacteria bacterium]|nr:MAG: cytidylate kinase [Deltaproteobacteria bacterium]